jgi:integrase
LAWTVQRQQRTGGGYYSAIFATEGQPRHCVTLGFVVSSLSTAEMTARLRRFDPNGRLDKPAVLKLLAAPTDDAAASTILFNLKPIAGDTPFVVVDRLDPEVERGVLMAMARDLVSGDGLFFPAGTETKTTLAGLAEQVGKLGPVPGVPEVTKSRPPSPPTPVIVPPDPRGTMSLDRYFEEVWTPVRRLTGSWERDRWWWEQRVLPALGKTRVCDLDEPAWTRFLAGLQVGGRSKALCQNAYRCALTHAVDELGWVDRLHAFKPIAGATLPSLAEPEPLEQEEVALLLREAPSSMHRALFGAQFGQGLRPGEVIKLRWEGVNWRAQTLHIKGTKNHQATATVALTPLTMSALRPWWEEQGCPSFGPVFLKSGGDGPMTVYPTGVLRGAAARAGLNADRRRKVFPYLARHTFATLAAANGIHSAHTRRMMRHSSTSSVLERAYEKASMRQVGAAFAGFGGEVDGELPGDGKPRS